MKLQLFKLAVFLALASSAHAQSCAGQLQPLKPVTVLCQDALVSCLCDGSGLNCRWIWSCASSGYSSTGRRAVEPSRPAQAGGGLHPIDTSMFQMLQPLDTGPSLLDRMLQVETIRNLQQQNEMLERMNREPTPAPASESLLTKGQINGLTWTRSREAAKLFYVAGYSDGLMTLVVDTLVRDERDGKDADASAKQAVATLVKYTPAELGVAAKLALLDRFFSDLRNLPIPVKDALEILAMKENGASHEAVDSRVVKERDAASREK